MLQAMLWSYLATASRYDGQGFHSSTLQIIASMTRHSGTDVQSWLTRVVRTKYHEHCLRVMAQRLHANSTPVLEQVSMGVAVSDELAALRLGVVCAIARLDHPCDMGRSLPLTFRPENLAPTAVHEARVVRRGATRTMLALLRTDDPCLRALLGELAARIAPADLAVASRDAGGEERFVLVRDIEGLANDTSTTSVLRSWARATLAAMAEDREDPELGHAAVCAIACAVHDEDPVVRDWARNFLTASSGDTGDAARAGCPILRLSCLSGTGGTVATATVVALPPCWDAQATGARRAGWPQGEADSFARANEEGRPLQAQAACDGRAPPRLEGVVVEEGVQAAAAASHAGDPFM